MPSFTQNPLLSGRRGARTLSWRISAVALLAAALEVAAQPLLTRVEQVRSLTPEQAGVGYPVRLRGVVTYSDPAYQLVFVQDATGGVYIYTTDQTLSVRPGQLVQVEGHTASNRRWNYIAGPTIALLGKAAMPVPLEGPFEQLSAGQGDSQWVQIRGVVLAAVVEDGRLNLYLAAGGGQIRAIIREFPRANLERLIGAAVSIRGVFTAKPDPRGRTTRHLLAVPSLSEMRLDQSANAEPSCSLGNLILLDGRAGGRVHACGTVTGQAGKLLFLQDGERALRVQTSQESSVQLGDRVEATGVPHAGEYTPALHKAEVRSLGTRSPLAPVTMSINDSFAGDYDSRLVRTEGLVVGQAEEQGIRVFRLQSGETIFDAVPAEPKRMARWPDLRPGSRVRLTGICTLVLADTGIMSVRVLLSSPRDLAVLTVSPWWTLRRLWWALIAACTLVLAALAWVITLRHRVRERTEALRRKLEREAPLERRYSDLFENANDPVFTGDLSGRITSLNRAGERITGCTREQVLGINLVELIAPEQQDLARRWFQDIDAHGEPPQAEFEVLTKGGGRRTLEFNLRRICQGGKPTGVQGICRDVTERKLAEGEVRKSEAFLRIITDLVPSRIAYVDAKQCYRFVNCGYEEWFAKPRAEIVGKHVKDLLGESLYQRTYPYIEEVLSGQKVTYVLDLEARDGTERQLNILYVPHFGERREVLGFFASLEDITERKHIEEALRESEERYRTVVQNLGEGVATIDEEERCLMANPAAERIFGVPPGGLAGRRITEFIPPAEAPKLQLETAKRRLGEESTYELAIVRQDGAQRTLLVTAAPRFDEEDRFLWTVAVFRDVTEGRSAEEALRLANAYNRSLIETSVDPLVTIGPDGRITDVNKATEEATGYSRSHLIGTDFSDYFTEPEKAREGYQLVFRDGLLRDYALELRHRDGSVKSVLYNASTYRDEAGQVAGVFAEARDITERKRTEEELRDLNANLEQRVLARTRELEDARRAALSMMQDAEVQRQTTEETLKKLSESTESLVMLWQAVENSPAVVVITDTNATIQYVNPKFAEVTGYSAQEAIGQSPRILKSGVHPTEFYKHLWSTITAGKTWFGEFCNRKKNGETYWETASISPVRGVDGQVRQFLAIKEDVTELKRVAEELQRAKESADEASRAKSSFLASMSHEIRTPLNAILGYAQLMLRDHSLGSPSKENLRIISRSGEHLLALINDVLEVSKIEAGRVGLEPSEFDLHALLRDLASMFVLRTTVKGVGFEVIEAEDLPRYVIADEGKTRQVLANLLSNAVKFTNEGRITVRAAVNKTETGQLLLAVEVEDTGAGIAPEEMGKLFRYFEQTRSGREAQGGTGLGLVISRDYARRMGGDISVASELGKGSVFRFEMPIALGMGTPSSSLADTRRVVGLAAGQPPLRVLLADDDETNRGWLSALLESVGFEVREATNGQEAVDIWQAWKPELVLMDMRMSVMDGYEATRRIRESPGGDTTVVIALTASTFEERMPVIMQAGVNDLVSKPFKENELFDAIGAHLGVSYLYEDAEASAEAGAREPLDAVSLAGLPAELLGRLRQAIASWDMDGFIQILPQVAEEDASVAVSLRRLADDYDYDALARLLEAPE